MKKELNVIIVNYNSHEMVKKSLNEYVSPKDIKTRFVIVDSFFNKNERDKIEEIVFKNKSFEIELIKPSLNVGYSEGNNIAYKKITDNNWNGNILILNSDVQIDSNSILELYDTLSDEIAVVSPRTLNSEKKVLYDRIDLSGFISTLKINDEIGVFDTDYSVGCCLMINRDILVKLNFEELFCSDFFMYWEEVDFCFKLIDYNYRCVSNNKARLIRANNTSGSIINQVYYLVRNSFYMKKKYPNRFTNTQHFKYITFQFFISLKYMLLRKNINILINYFKGLKDGYEI